MEKHYTHTHTHPSDMTIYSSALWQEVEKAGEEDFLFLDTPTVVALIKERGLGRSDGDPRLWLVKSTQ